MLSHQELVREIVLRTELPHDEVEATLAALRTIIEEQARILGGVKIRGIGGIACKQWRTSNWRMVLLPYRGIVEKIGVSFGKQ